MPRVEHLQSFTAGFADVRTFSSVDANVDGQSRTLDERLAAFAKVASERAFLAVDASVSVKVQGQREKAR